MHKLTDQLKYFINKKVSEDTDWQGVRILFSGHEVPGEGEHKIMEYIRLAKAQPDYDPNVRHCLYGLDADLIMLGLSSHDPHFCLLREEVTYGRANKAKSKELEHQNFYLMHLCMLREYLELEFQELKNPGALKFDFDLERVIDDFILMAFFVGNDFLPHLPNLHINEGALSLMFKVYKTILPKAGGYINEDGAINMERLAILLEELSHIEARFFESDISEKKWLDSKKTESENENGNNNKNMIKGSIPDKIRMTSSQKKIWIDVKKFLSNKSSHSMELPNKISAADRKFFQDLSERAFLRLATSIKTDNTRHTEIFHPSIERNEEFADVDMQQHLSRIIDLYDNAEIRDMTEAEVGAEMDLQREKKFQRWKRSYYDDKFRWSWDNDNELVTMCQNYVQGLQWVLFYYYRGVASWSWYYRYHYSPMISDIIKGLGADINFKLGKPFRPFEQLMGVLPDRSKHIIPVIYQSLMTDPNSPIIHYYPREFELDMNGKKMPWEAVIKIPFIDEECLLAAMAPFNEYLSDEEKKRNGTGSTLQYLYEPNINHKYVSSLSGIFPDIPYCRCVETIFELPTMDGLEYHIGLMDGVKLGDAALAGFPSLSLLPFNASLEFHGVELFQSESRGMSMVVTIDHPALTGNSKTAVMKLGQIVFVGYPYLQEGRVVKVSDELFDYLPSNDGTGQPVQKTHNYREIEEFGKKAERIETYYSKHLAIIIGSVTSITHVELLKGLKKTDDGATVKEYANIPGIETEFASQIIVDEVINEDPRFLEQAALSVEEEFPIGTRAFFLDEPNYGRPLEIISHQDNCANIWLSVGLFQEPNFAQQVIRDHYTKSPYTPAYVVAQILNLNPLLLSKITSSLSVTTSGQSRINMGLNLKFESKKLKVLGYSRKSDKGWEYSNKAIELIRTYKTKFPEFFDGIQQNLRNNEYRANDIYPEDIADAKIKEIVAWLKSIESKRFERVSLDSEQLDSDTISTLQTAVDTALAAVDQSRESSYKKLEFVPRNALIKPADAEHRLGNQKFSIGDRVVYVQDSGRVPIATRGIVVGISHTPRVVLLDTLFDVTFMSGTTLNGRCSPFRGSTVPVSSVINLTNKQLVTKVNTHIKKSPKPEMRSDHNNSDTTHILGSRGVYHSSVPPNLRRGTYSDALGQPQNNLSRSNIVFPRPRGNPWSNYENSRQANSGSMVLRGGPTRKPEKPREVWDTVNQARVQENSWDRIPQYQSYNAVPPPNFGSSVVNRGWSRGRGRSGYRSTRGRGSSQPSPIHQP